MITKEAVYNVTRQIPKGKVATYKQIATLAGNSKAARFVGTCMRTNPNIPSTPCHRVVGSDGSFRGYAAGEGIPTKIDMLRDEGVSFKNGKVDLKTSQWKPDHLLN